MLLVDHHLHEAVFLLPDFSIDNDRVEVFAHVSEHHFFGVVEACEALFVFFEDVDLGGNEQLNDLAPIVQGGDVEHGIAHLVTDVDVDSASIDKELNHVIQIILDSIVKRRVPHFIDFIQVANQVFPREDVPQFHQERRYFLWVII